ncbi:hypothetical protein [Minwuia sp.]|uniref:hypothetical protein n=1 Tax=Minwuia sp. TaxID=2493630 RepID=UPI003A929F12
MGEAIIIKVRAKGDVSRADGKSGLSAKRTRAATVWQADSALRQKDRRKIVNPQPNGYHCN